MSENKTESQSQDKIKTGFTDVSFLRVGPEHFNKSKAKSARTESDQTFAKTLETDL